MTATTQTATSATTGSGFMPMVLAALVGVAIVAMSGFVQAGALHDAAHDVRHASGFPCH